MFNCVRQCRHVLETACGIFIEHDPTVRLLLMTEVLALIDKRESRRRLSSTGLLSTCTMVGGSRFRTVAFGTSSNGTEELL